MIHNGALLIPLAVIVFLLLVHFDPAGLRPPR